MLHKLSYNRYFFFLIGVFVSYFSSLSILETGSVFWLNDEGLFYNWALQNTLDLNTFFDNDTNNNHSIYTYIRYKFFTEIIEFYFLFFQDPLYVLLTHKFIIIFIYTFLFAPYIIKNYGFFQFILIYISLMYLNLSFLRESLLCLMGLSFLLLSGIIFNRYNFKENKYITFSKKSIKISSLLAIFFLRPQVVIFFLDKKYIYLSSIILIIFSLLLNFYEKGYLQDLISFQGDINFNLFKNKIYQIYSDYVYKFDIKHFVITIFSSINSLNPFTKIAYYVDQNLVLDLILLSLSSLILIFFLYQLIISTLLKKNKIPHSNELIISLLITFLLYGFSGIQIDLRVLISVLSPFLIYYQPHLLTFKSFVLIISILILILPLKMIIL